MRSESTKTIAAVSIIILGFIGVFFLSNFMERSRPIVPESYSNEDLLIQGKNMKGYALGFEGLLADWYWIRSLQYIGDKIAASKQKAINIGDLRYLNPRLLYPMLDNATSLDPRFMAGYSYGAIVLPAIDEKQAIRIIEKGVKNNPNEWRFYQYLGFIYWQSKDFEKAAISYEKGSQIQGAPIWFKTMAAAMKDQGGERETARKIYQQLLEQAEDSQTKENAQSRILRLDSLDEIDALNTILERIQKQTGSCPKDLKEILGSVRTVMLPQGREFRIDQSSRLVDPRETPYLLDRSACKAILDAKNSKIPLR